MKYLNCSNRHHNRQQVIIRISKERSTVSGIINFLNLIVSFASVIKYGLVDFAKNLSVVASAMANDIDYDMN